MQTKGISFPSFFSMRKFDKSSGSKSLAYNIDQFMFGSLKYYMIFIIEFDWID